MGRLEGRVAVITGAGSGIGLAMARLFAHEGAAVVIAEYSDARGTTAAAEIVKSGGRAVFVRGDVTRWEDVDRAVQEALHRYQALHVMVNNGSSGNTGVAG